MQWYPKQLKIINHQGDIAIRGGRQTGKSESTAERIVKLAEEYPGKTSLITSPSENQENFLYFKVKDRLERKSLLKKRATLKFAQLKNGHKIYKIPVGKTGIYIEGLSSVDFLYIDEAKNMTERAWDAIIPMTAEPRSRGLGWVTMLSNTRGKPAGTFYEAFKPGSGYEQVHMSAEECPHISKEFLAKERERLGELRYRAIWLGEFVESDYYFFDKTQLERARRIMRWTIAENYSSKHRYFVGIDPARLGKDKAGIVIAEMQENKVRIIHYELIKKCRGTELMQIVERLHNIFKFERFFIDGTGVGGYLCDMLIEKYGSKIIELSASMKKQGENMKEDLYANTQRLLEQDRLEILNSEEIMNSLSSVQYDGEQFSGKETDLCEALVRACYCAKNKSLRPMII